MAAELAELAGGATVDLVHVAAEARDYLPLDRWIWGGEAESHATAERSRKTVRAVFDDYVQGLPDDLRDRVNPRLEFGEPVARILEIAEAGDYDLMVVGTHGRTGVPRLLLGSVAERVIARAPCPVLAVH
jgi:nucleotide-binding universal stress UspA family protein